MFVFLFYFITWATPTVPVKPAIDELLDRAVKNSLSVQMQSYKVEETKNLGSSQTAWSNPNLTLESQKGDDNTGMPINKHQLSIVQPITSPWKTNQ